MATKKTTKKQTVSSDRGQDIVSQLEQAFVAGLGALSDAQEAGNKAFDKLVEQDFAYPAFETPDELDASDLSNALTATTAGPDTTDTTDHRQTDTSACSKFPSVISHDS